MQTVHHIPKDSSIEYAFKRLKMNYIHKAFRLIEILIALFKIPKVEMIGEGGL